MSDADKPACSIDENKYLTAYRKSLEQCGQCANTGTPQNCESCRLIGVVLYGECTECGTVYDMWKYRQDQAEGRCPGCGATTTLKPLTVEEAEQAFRKCKDAGCFEEIIL